MREIIRERRSFSDVDLDGTAYIPYEPYLEIPKCTDYSDGKKSKIILRNKSTGVLEEISYKMSGGVPFDSRPGYYWFWGDVESEDVNCCLVFYFKIDGALDKISLSFCGKYPTSEELKKMNSGIRYAAEFSTRGAF